MIFESLNNNVMLVELSDDEMKTYNITYESLNNQDADTQIAIRKLLDHIDNKNSIKTGGKVVVEALPIDGGGCFFIFTFIQDRRKYKLKRAEPNSFFVLEKLDDFHKGNNKECKTKSDTISLEVKVCEAEKI